MAKIVVIVIDRASDFNLLARLFIPTEDKIVLAAVLSDSQKNHKDCWCELFRAQVRFQELGYKVSVATERGSLFNIIALQDKLQANVLAVPKELFLSLPTDEYSDFLEQIRVPLILY
ncbi:MAG: hypothetical protein ABIK10_03940 [candidate division WOR-3 bacterium]